MVACVTFFLDVDVLLNTNLASDNINHVNRLYQQGSVIILTTTQSEDQRAGLLARLSNVKFHYLILGVNNNQALLTQSALVFAGSVPSSMPLGEYCDDVLN